MSRDGDDVRAVAQEVRLEDGARIRALQRKLDAATQEKSELLIAANGLRGRIAELEAALRATKTQF